MARTITKKPTAYWYDDTYSKLSNVPNCYDDDINTYASKPSSSSTYTAHLNGFDFNIPSNATVDNLTVYVRNTVSNTSYGLLSLYLTKGKTDRVYGAKKITNTDSTPQYISRSYSIDELYEYASYFIHGAGDTVKSMSDVISFINDLTLLVRSSTSGVFKSSDCKIYDIYITVTYSLPKFTLTLTATEGGTVTGGGTYESGTTATLTATPSDGYKFVKWSDGDTNATRTVTVTADATYTAVFEKTSVNKIYVGTQNPTVYVGTTKVNSVYVGTTKIYGQE